MARATKRDLQLIHYILKDKKPSMSMEDVAIGVQLIFGITGRGHTLTIAEAAHLLRKTKYLVRKAVEEARLEPVGMRPCKGQPTGVPCYDGSKMLSALGMDPLEIVEA